MSTEDRAFWMTLREILLMALRLVEKKLGMKESVPSKRSGERSGSALRSEQ